MATRPVMTERAAMQRFIESVHDLAENPSAPNVSRYLRASAELDPSAPNPRAFRARTPQSKNAPECAA